MAENQSPSNANYRKHHRTTHTLMGFVRLLTSVQSKTETKEKRSYYQITLKARQTKKRK